MITYRFFFEGLITEFGNKLPDRFFPWWPIFEFGNNYLPVSFPGGAIFESGKMPETGFIPGVPFLSQVTILYFTFSDFFTCKDSTIQHTFSTHHTQYTTTHSIQDPQYISTAHHIT